MLLVSYDISDDKLRAQFSKFLSKYGGRIQYSMFEIRNSDRVIEIITLKIESYFGKRFDQRDSVMIFNLSNTCKIIKFGYAKNSDEDLILI
jgi:CRISPR-associated protein Cas2